MDEKERQQSKIWLFSYGSNSAVQLRARVQNPDLDSFPATATGWDRIFCNRADRWGGTGVASLARSAHSHTLGSAALLTSAELCLLDAFELPTYERMSIDIIVMKDGEELNVRAVAYLAVCPHWVAPPSEQYLTAIHYMLSEQWAHIHPELNIAVKGIFHSDDYDSEHPQIRKISEWIYPGAHLLSLPALCVEVNARQPPAKCWVMPATINEIVEKFASVGIHSAAQLAVRLSTAPAVHLFGEGECVFLPSGAELGIHTLHSFKELLLLEGHHHDRK